MAPKGEASDTRTGTDHSGATLPHFICSRCRECGFVAPFSRALACPSCGFFPWAKGLPPHHEVLATWRSHAVWWKPHTWFTGQYVRVRPGPVTVALERVQSPPTPLEETDGATREG